ncbi:MAG: alpha-glucan family phosphorylase [Armatimonadetes bacterium]|nr:alpha-glucan family phosphorylase [Armatimonadota bacterium]
MKLTTLDINPVSLPEELIGLDRLAKNLFWSWHPEVTSLFADLDPDLWASKIGPVELLRRTQNLVERSSDKKYVARVKQAEKALDEYLSAGKTWWSEQNGDPHHVIAYFCAEYGLHETVTLYSGGLGILAGDHLKEASDMGLPLVAVGLLYRKGFFHQTIDFEGRQEHRIGRLNPADAPILAAVDPKSGRQIRVAVEFPGRTVSAAVWVAEVGRMPLLLLDTDVPENSPEDRAITSQLYTSGRDMRLHQEIILGIGGTRALAALGIEPSVWHMNEGHSAFLLIERLAKLTSSGKSLADSQKAIRASSILTIHTPVPAGNERFDAKHVSKVLAPIFQAFRSPKDILKLGLDSVSDPKIFDLTAMALRLSRISNGVSLLHGVTADQTWKNIAGRTVIGVTNGVHMPTWLGPEMRNAFERAGAKFAPTELVLSKGLSRGEWNGVESVSDDDLWAAHQAQKARLIEFARKRLYDQHARLGAGPEELRMWLNVLDPETLTIGFARRFATYKRAAMLFTDERRLARMLDSSDRPLQIVFAGKAHPADRAGQSLIAKVYQATQNKRFRGKVVLLEEYDMEMGRHLVQGVDVWLNNPRRPLEASGTSGMKAAANGVPNLSILDGWWDEAFDHRKGHQNGWAIGNRELLKSERQQDRNDALSLYETLENEVIPTFYKRNKLGLPADWLKIMRRSIASSVYAFSTKRMLEDYVAEMIGRDSQGPQLNK